MGVSEWHILQFWAPLRQRQPRLHPQSGRAAALDHRGNGEAASRNARLGEFRAFYYRIRLVSLRLGSDSSRHKNCISSVNNWPAHVNEQ